MSIFNERQKNAIEFLLTQFQGNQRPTQENINRIKTLIFSDDNKRRQYIADDIADELLDAIDKNIQALEDGQLKQLKKKKQELKDALGQGSDVN